MMKSTIALVISLTASVALAQQTPFETVVQGAKLGGGNIEPILLDIGEKCQVNPREQPMTWFNGVIFGIANKGKVQEAIKAKAEQNQAGYDRAIKAISCQSA